MSRMITADLVDLDLAADTKEAAARSLAERMVARGRVTDLDGFLADVAAREAQMPTGLDGGIGIPHCRSAHVTEPTLAFGRSAAGVDFGAPDGPADLIFLIAAPAGADDAHLTILSSLARQLMNEEFTGALRSVATPEEAAALIAGEEAEEPPAEEEAEEESGEAPEGVAAGAEATGAVPFRIVAVTSCPTGIAHTYMAAESLEKAGHAAGVEVSVETQGSAGFTRLDPAVVAAADGVIFAHDVPVREKERFAGKATVDVGVKAGINRPAELIAEVREKAARGEVSAPATAASPVDKAGEPGEGYGTKLRKWLMSGVSYMVPFVAAGGLLIALGFAIGGWNIDKAPSVTEHFAWGQADSWAALMFQIGGLAFSFLVPVLAGYISYGMADRPGLVPGFVGGAIALTVNAGFLGGLVAGLLAGGTVLAIQRVRIPTVLRGIMPVVVIPLLSSIVVGFLMFLVVGKPIASLQKALTDWLSGLSGANAVILGVILGLMMCFDLGGPVNKVAYAFAVGGLANPNEGSLKVMAAVMAAGMVPPLAMALATAVRGRLFTRTERENGKAAWVLGASFISEGAIPFAAADPLRVIPATMAGGAVTGALSMAFECTLRAPHGGLFVLPLIGNPLLYLLAIVAGTVVSAGLVILLKGLRKTAPEGDGAVPAVVDPQVTVAA
ncbi:MULTISPECIES: PTS fructose transporter subunit IIABC [Streptomyces]|uniref:PTS system, fructose-specific IIA component or PTS system, fructose-specific IIB component or PTS system,fructose-specific IIC component n=1 Tax=Streptomyces venezuelae (strain ATCC 10712 / CBS 650.69 / DSM 40230 / JCM 4526 / NBRC 13096 / PD 04745) TaxID=953739 RepID=F2R7Q3_STRVP|nr:fructose-specific PTS transporter subunit EIIC [Streptomyces venezuelae]APE22198.1 PTS lactose transporter subunit IIC [Streptomyces venezuelae]QER99581.1 PTS lactose transporter subunit IIC [Streptomyces venezuelae ATCC 10712]CCA56338.1 PTS system, fructose-specific IIA component or PTS system, fructose-specific IIB component or PTS system,fructose-specific IIC component [Streptomyces venezuelae ATCC 10712]